MKKNLKVVAAVSAAFLALPAGSVPSFAQEALSGTPAEQIAYIQDLIQKTGAKWGAGENSLSNLSQEEWQYRVGLIFQPIDAPPIDLTNVLPPPPSLDWRDNNGNYVSAITDQKKCGSCWAFAMTAGLESNVLRTQNTGGANVDLSEQVMLSCSGAGSCSGGYLNAGFLQKTGLPPESFYPYLALDGNCADAAPGWQNEAKKINAWGSVSKNLAVIKTALAANGPLPTAFYVYEDFKYYKSGIYSYTTGKRLGGHAVLLVGYNDAQQYFIVKNSWGPGWGENGFFKIAYSQMNNSVNFGLSTIAYRAKIAQRGPETFDNTIEPINADGRWAPPFWLRFER